MKLPNRPISSLKQNYLLYFEAALILVLGTFIGLFNLNLPEKANHTSNWTNSEQEILHLESIAATIHTPAKPAPPPDVIVPNPPPKNEIIEEQQKISP